MKANVRLLIGVSIILSGANLLAKSSPASALPKDWVRCKEPDLMLTRDTNPEWDVHLVKGQVKVVPVIRQNELELPFEVKGNQSEGIVGYQHTRRVSEGWLAGYDGGEFGGSLWWFGKDGKQRKKLSGENVLGLLEYPTGVAVLTRLAHSGSVLFVPKGKREAKRLVDLEGPPRNYFKESDQSLLVVAYGGGWGARFSIGTAKAYFLRVTLDGKRKYISPRPEINILAAKSAVVTDSGEIYVGYGEYIVRLTPFKKGYSEQWYRHVRAAHLSVNKKI